VVWAEARKKVLTAAQCRPPLGRCPYDLRHAAVCLWLNSGVPAEVALCIPKSPSGQVRGDVRISASGELGPPRKSRLLRHDGRLCCFDWPI